jgi:uncharacterized protein YecE (DUF72 family)
MTVFVGTSGWQYRHWRGRFYPEDLAQKRWLEHYAEHFAVVESNNAFYRLPSPEIFAGWAARTPEDFRFTVKMSRYLTHIRRLREPAEPVERFLAHATSLGRKLAPVLLQLPPTLRAEVGLLEETLGRFGGRARVAVELRHASWFTDDVRRVLESHGAALCLADGELGTRPGRAASRPVSPLWRTTDWGYLRLHHGAAAPSPCYGRTALRSWAERLGGLWERGDEIYVLFNNDGEGCAVRDAGVFASEVSRAGLEPTRVPAPSEVGVG